MQFLQNLEALLGIHSAGPTPAPRPAPTQPNSAARQPLPAVLQQQYSPARPQVSPRLLIDTGDTNVAPRQPYHNILQGLVFGNNRSPVNRPVPMPQIDNSRLMSPPPGPFDAWTTINDNVGNTWYENEGTGQRVLAHNPGIDQPLHPFQSGLGRRNPGPAVAAPQYLQPANISPLRSI